MYIKKDLFPFAEESGGVKSKIARALTAENQKALDEFLKGSRYFIIKSNNYENVALSKAKVSLFVYLELENVVVITPNRPEQRRFYTDGTSL